MAKITKIDSSSRDLVYVYVWENNQWEIGETFLASEGYKAKPWAEQYEKSHPAPTGKIKLLSNYPDRNYGVMEKANYEGWAVEGTYPNSPQGWEKARAKKSDMLSSFYKSNGHESTPPHFKIE